MFWQIETGIRLLKLVELPIMYSEKLLVEISIETFIANY